MNKKDGKDANNIKITKNYLLKSTFSKSPNPNYNNLFKPNAILNFLSYKMIYLTEVLFIQLPTI